MALGHPDSRQPNGTDTEDTEVGPGWGPSLASQHRGGDFRDRRGLSLLPGTQRRRFPHYCI